MIGEAPGKNEAKYDLLINVANWPEKRSIAWKTLLQARAIENQSYVVGVNRVGEGDKKIYSGDSMIIDPLGEIIYLKNKEEDIFTYTLQKEKVDEVRNHFEYEAGSIETLRRMVDLNDGITIIPELATFDTGIANVQINK